MKRRDLLKSMAATSLTVPTFSKFLQTVVDGIIAKAYAEEMEQAVGKRYGFLNIGGGLNALSYLPGGQPFSGMTFNANAQMINRFTAGVGNKIVGQYAVLPVTMQGPTGASQTYQLPPIFQGSLPRPSGPRVPFSVLLQHMLAVRGIRMPADSHNLCSVSIQQPVPQSFSIAGSVAAQSQSPMSAVAGGYSSTFKAPGGRSPNTLGLYELNPNTPITRLFAPFLSPTTGNSLSTQRLSVLEGAVAPALEALDAYMLSRKPGSRILASDRKSAKEIIQRCVNGITQANSDFTAYYMKYTQLIEDSKSLSGGVATIPGVMDSGAVAPTGDVRSRNSDSKILENPDLREILSSAKLMFTETREDLAAAFALLEYTLKSDFTRVCVAGTQGYFGDFNYKINGGYSLGRHSVDEHNCGSYVSLIINSWVLAALGACTIELTSQLGNDYVFQIGSEFLRSPIADGSGSDHGFQNYQLLAWSDAMPFHPTILGNMWINPPDANTAAYYNGTWVGAPVRLPSGVQYIGPDHAASTICHLIGCPSPTPNAASLILKTPQGAVPTVPTAKNISSTEQA